MLQIKYIMQAATTTPNMTSNLSSVPMGDSGQIDIDNILYVLGEIVIAIATIIGNSLVLVAIVKEPRLHTINNYFIANLATADLLVGVLGIPCALLPGLGKPVGFSACLFVNSQIIILTQISIFGLLAIALERFVAIRYPFQYKVKLTTKRTMFVICMLWVAGIAVGVLPLLGWNKRETYKDGSCLFTNVINMEYMVYFNFFGCVLVPLGAMFGIYCYIYYIVRQQIQQISSLQQAAVTAIAYSNSQDEKLLTAAQKQTKDAFAKETKAAKWFAVVILAFALCWLPLHIINTIIVLTKKYNNACMLFAILLSHVNSAINPVFYAYVNTRFKKAFRKFLSCQRSKTKAKSKSEKEDKSNNNSPEHQSININGMSAAAPPVPPTPPPTPPSQQEINTTGT